MSAHETSDLETEDVPLNRTTTPVSGNLGVSRFGRAAAVTALGVVCGLLVLAPWKREDRPAAAKTPPPRQTVAFDPARHVPTLDDPGPDAPSLEDVSALASEIEADSGQAAAGSPGPRATAGAASRPSPVLAWSAPGRRSDDGVREASGSALAEADPNDAQTAGEPNDAYRVLQQTETIRTVRARRLGDRNLLLIAGTSIPCTLQTAMDSSMPGQVICLVGRNVWSDNGSVVLIEKGARVMGEYRQGLKAGEGRLFVLWTRLVTPSGVAVDLASPAADGLGRAGFGGEVDRHFWRRFGGAVLLSMVDGAAVAALDGDGGGRAVTRLPSQAASIAVDRSIDIAPTLRKPQGARVTIMAARDLDFSQVYGLRSSQGGGR